MHYGFILGSTMLAMPKGRRVVLPAFGEHLKELRRQAGWKTQSIAARRAQQRGLSTVVQAKLSRLELGQNSDPDPAFLRDVAQLYQVHFPQLLDVFVTEKYGVPPRPPSETVTTIEGFKPVRWLHAPIAAGRPLAIDQDDDADRWLAFQERWLKPYDRPLCLTVGRDEQSMLPTIQPLDVVLIDQCLERRATLISGGIYAVNLSLLMWHAKVARPPSPVVASDARVARRFDFPGASASLSPDFSCIFCRFSPD